MHFRSILLLTVLVGTASLSAAENDRFANVQIKAQQASGNVYMLTGAGGNIGVSVGEDGTLIIDDQFLPLAPRILRAITELGGDQPKLILNTHYHGDHTGGNSAFGRDGTILAHNNVHARLISDEKTPASALPVVTFEDRVRVNFNGDQIDFIHLPHGHTDGDSAVFFRNANVVHLGDHFFNGGFPYVDLPSGGSVTGLMNNIERVHDMLADDATIIPGHGAMADKADLKAYLDMLKFSIGHIQTQIDAGQTVDEMISTGMGEDYAAWGAGFINEERWIRIVQESLQRL